MIIPNDAFYHVYCFVDDVYKVRLLVSASFLSVQPGLPSEEAEHVEPAVYAQQWHGKTHCIIFLWSCNCLKQRFLSIVVWRKACTLSMRYMYIDRWQAALKSSSRGHAYTGDGAKEEHSILYGWEFTERICSWRYMAKGMLQGLRQISWKDPKSFSAY